MLEGETVTGFPWTASPPPSRGPHAVVGRADAGESGPAAAAPVPDIAPTAYPPLSLVLPTYNESKNLPRLLPRLTRVLEHAGAPFEIIVVDDDSPDGTWALAGEMALADSRLRLIRRRGQRGLATAVVAGWKAARGEILGVMDADLQYPPEGLPGLLAAMADEAVDVVVASRYTPGAHLGPWALERELISRRGHPGGEWALPRAQTARSPLSSEVDAERFR
jgi:dolichol-phosphate mannosyltransferase